MRRYRLTGLVALMLLAACGDPEEVVPPRGEPPPSPHEYSCGTGVFTPHELEEGPEPSRDLRDAIERLRGRGEGWILPADGWRIVSEDADEVSLVAGTPGRFASVTFEKQQDRWKATGYGDCTPRLVVEDRSVLQWAFTEDSHPPDADATELAVLVVEPQCSSGRKLEGLIEQQIAYREESIEVMLTAPELSRGAHTCIGTAPTAYTLELDEPVDGRKVIDPSVYPPKEPGPGTPL